MNAKSFVLVLSAFFLCSAAGSAFAGPRQKVGKAHTNARQHRQEHRIRKGVESGELTKKEAARLKAEQKAVNKMEEEALEDGHLSKKEKKHLQRAQNAASRDIYRQKHDEQQRPEAKPSGGEETSSDSSKSTDTAK